jgi:NADP-dependent 3-hydroxy acid dehydrogenase YdfG
VDVLITSAGATRPTHFDEIDVATFRQLMDINYLGTVSCVKAVLPHMYAHQRHDTTRHTRHT